MFVGADAVVTLRSWQRVAGLPEVVGFAAIERAVISPIPAGYTGKRPL